MSISDSCTDCPDHVRRCNETVADYPRQPIPVLFREQVRRRPDQIAIRADERTWTYRELHTRASGVAQTLLAAGVGPDDVVAVLMPRSPEAIAAILGVLMAGAAYLPLDPDHPDARIALITEQAGPRVAIAPRGRLGQAVGCDLVAVEDLPAAATSPIPAPAVTAEDRAYVIYTSGSTGTPKGVAVPHRAVVRLVRGGAWLRLGPDDVVLATTSLTFDVSCFEIFGALLNGARLVLPDKETLLSAVDLHRLMRAECATVMWLSAGLFHQHATTHPHMFSTLRCLLAGGDALNPGCVRAVLEHGRPGRFLNGYGPTENGVLSTAHELEPDDVVEGTLAVPIGRPVSNSTAYVLRRDLSVADVGEEGELYVGGDGVAQGYHNAPELTRARFLPDPFSDRRGATLYRTGDMARWRRDNVIEFLGRRDRQVKIRGYRVELREIELAVAAHPRVREAAVSLHEPRPGQQDLACWIVPEHGPRCDRGELAGQLRRYLRDHLPFYMIPARITVVGTLPLNASGKIDRGALPATPHSAPVSPDRRPRTRVERVVAEVWQNALGVETIARDEDFFALGGQSLHTTQVAAALRHRLGIAAEHGRTLIARLLATPTLAEFATIVAALEAGTTEPAPGESADFAADSRLGPLAPAPRRACWPPRTVFLTGGTGFLGVFLVDRLVRAGVERVYCLVRAASDDAATARIAARTRRYGLDWTRVRDHVTALAGDLATPGLGLGDRFHHLAARADAIVHNGSHVNFAYPYHALRAPNVQGTREVIRLACTDRVKPLHYISSIAVIAGFGPAGTRHVTEDTPLAHVERICLGYPESKWVAEQLVHAAGDQGLPIAVHRPYEITGARDTGIWNTDTMMCALFRSIAETGIAPDIPLPLDFVPVDFTADAITHIVLTHRPDGRVYHVTNPRDARLGLLTDRLRARGYRIRDLPYDRWVTRMSARTAADPDEPMAPYLPMFVEPAADTGISVKEMYFAGTFPRFSRNNFDTAIAGTGLHCPPVDANLIDLYLDHFADSGFLTPHQRRHVA
ncbi:amino acid adenylation domain-containing protein [Amycolatopsis samaneae]|uniref:Amino acid adenylation domain-containing protein n=1 Tax=Amycolatopsis samaneae TaxID=664691 RepID=A0ABW5GGM8_9PSEU